MSTSQKYHFNCLKCGKDLQNENDQLVTCPTCGGPLSIKMNLKIIERESSRSKFYNKPINSMWSFFEFLPLYYRKNIISLMEGNTPVLKSKRLSEKLKIKDLWLKLDYLNPTGSFKDRQISMGISKAHEMNNNSVITMSSGNVGAAVAAYSSRAGLKNIIIVPSIAPDSKIVQIRHYGGDVVKIASDSTNFISEIVKKASREFNMANLITANIYNPFINNGAKTISYEIAIQCKELGLPDVIIIPVGGSGLLSGIYEGFEELKSLNYISSVPKLIGVQPEGCAPFVEAIKADLSPEVVIQSPWTDIDTISTALADDIPLDCYSGIKAVKNSSGYAVSVSDKETLSSSKHLAQLEGIFAEPSSCTTIAAIEKLFQMDIVDRKDSIMCLITGSGFKDIESIKESLNPLIEVEQDFNWKEIFNRILS